MVDASILRALRPVRVLQIKRGLDGEARPSAPAALDEREARGAPGVPAHKAQALRLKPRVCKADKKLRQPLRFLLKLLIFNCAVFAVYSLLLFVLGLESLRAEFSDMGKIMLLVTLVLGNGIFILFDFVLPRLELLYRCRFRPHLWR